MDEKAELEYLAAKTRDGSNAFRNVSCPHCKETNTEIVSFTSSDGYNVVFKCNGICNGRPFAPTSDPLALAALMSERPYGELFINAVTQTWNSSPFAGT